jgi:hypothetical protein
MKALLMLSTAQYQAIATTDVFTAVAINAQHTLESPAAATTKVVCILHQQAWQTLKTARSPET